MHTAYVFIQILITFLNFVLCTEEDFTASHCFIIPLNPSFLFADGGINHGTRNVMINCNCFNTDYQTITWYSPKKQQIPFQLTEPGDLPYAIKEKGTLVIPVFNNLYQGTYYCGIGNNPLFASNISLTLWTGMFMFVNKWLHN